MGEKGNIGEIATVTTDSGETVVGVVTSAAGEARGIAEGVITGVATNEAKERMRKDTGEGGPAAG